MAFHDVADAAIPGLAKDLADSWSRQRLRYKSNGKLITIDFNPQKKLSKTAKNAIRTTVNWKADELADQWAQKHSGKLVQNIDNQSRLAVRELGRQLKTGQKSPAQVHAILGSIVGLTDRNAAMIAAMVAKGATQDQIDAHTKQLLTSRGKQIAHNEALTAANMGLQLAYERGLETGLLKPNSRKVWQTEADTRVCPICAPMRRKQAKIAEPFKNGVFVPPAHPGCRCTMSLNIAS